MIHYTDSEVTSALFGSTIHSLNVNDFSSCWYCKQRKLEIFRCYDSTEKQLVCVMPMYL